MKLRFFIVLLSALLVANLGAQTTAERTADRAANRAENRAQSNVDRKVDNAVDDAFNAIGGLFKKKKKKKKKKKDQEEVPTEATDYEPEYPAEENYEDEDYSDEEEEAAQTAMLQNMGLMGGKWEPYTNPITVSLDMEMVQTKRNGKVNKSTVQLTITETQYGMRTHELEGDDMEDIEEVRMILNTQTGKVVLVNTDKKGKVEAMRMNMPGLGKAIQEAQEESIEDMEIKRTGEYRTIDGYNCEKVIFTNTSTGEVTTGWCTKDIDLSIEDIAATFGGMTRGKSPAYDAMLNDFPGFPIEMTMVEEKEET
ncbi:MAG: DUF4412 domain-containing protein, partial [Bacteroidota bacterium]